MYTSSALGVAVATGGFSFARHFWTQREDDPIIVQDDAGEHHEIAQLPLRTLNSDPDESLRSIASGMTPRERQALIVSIVGKMDFDTPESSKSAFFDILERRKCQEGFLTQEMIDEYSDQRMQASPFQDRTVGKRQLCFVLAQTQGGTTDGASHMKLTAGVESNMPAVFCLNALRSEVGKMKDTIRTFNKFIRRCATLIGLRADEAPQVAGFECAKKIERKRYVEAVRATKDPGNKTYPVLLHISTMSGARDMGKVVSEISVYLDKDERGSACHLLVVDEADTIARSDVGKFAVNARGLYSEDDIKKFTELEKSLHSPIMSKSENAAGEGTYMEKTVLDSATSIVTVTATPHTFALVGTTVRERSVRL